LIFKASKKKRRSSKERSDEHSVRDGAIICVICLLAALTLSFIAIKGYRDARIEKTELENEIASLEYTRDVYNTYLQYQSGADALTAFDASIDSPNDELTDFIGELEEKMPAEILVLSATCTRENVSMNITVPSYDEVAVVLVQLRTFESLGDISISSVTETVNESGIKTVSFSVTCSYVSNTDIAAVAAEG